MNNISQRDIFKKGNGQEMSRLEKLLIALEKIADENEAMVFYVDEDQMPIAGEEGFIQEISCKTFIYLLKGLNEKSEVKNLAHELGHMYKGMRSIFTLPGAVRLYEEQAWDWAATRLVPHREYKKMMRNPHINSDYDMAEVANSQ